MDVDLHLPKQYNPSQRGAYGPVTLCICLICRTAEIELSHYTELGYFCWLIRSCTKPAVNSGPIYPFAKHTHIHAYVHACTHTHRGTQTHIQKAPLYDLWLSFVEQWPAPKFCFSLVIAAWICQQMIGACWVILLLPFWTLKVFVSLDLILLE